MALSKKSKANILKENDALRRTGLLALYIFIVSNIAAILIIAYHDETALKAIQPTYRGIGVWFVVFASMIAAAWGAVSFLPLWMLRNKAKLYSYIVMSSVLILVSLLWINEVLEFRKLVVYDDFERFEFFGLLPGLPLIFLGPFIYILAPIALIGAMYVSYQALKKRLLK